MIFESLALDSSFSKWLYRCKTKLLYSSLLSVLIRSRETGALSRIIDRGSRAINFILSAMVFNVVPTILEVWLYTSCLWAFFLFDFVFNDKAIFA